MWQVNRTLPYCKPEVSDFFCFLLLLVTWLKLFFKSRRNKYQARWINSYAEYESKVLLAVEKKMI